MSRANICRERQQLLRPLCNLVLLPSSSVFGDNKKKLFDFDLILELSFHLFFFFSNLIHNNTTALTSTTNSTSLC